MKIGDKIELWSTYPDGSDIRLVPSQYSREYLIVKSIADVQDFLMTVVTYDHEGRQVNETLMFIDPNKYEPYWRNRKLSYRGTTVEYHLDQIMDSKEDLL